MKVKERTAQLEVNGGWREWEEPGGTPMNVSTICTFRELQSDILQLLYFHCQVPADHGNDCPMELTLPDGDEMYRIHHCFCARRDEFACPINYWSCVC